MSEEHLTIEQVGRRLGVTREWVYKLMAECGMEPAVPGGHGRGKGARLTLQQAETLRENRAKKLEDRLDRVRAGEPRP